MKSAGYLIGQKSRRASILFLHFIKRKSGPITLQIAVALATLSLIVTTELNRAFALPSEGIVTAGQAAISSTSPTEMHIVQESRKAIIDWNTFSISKNELLNITQPDSHSTLLNRVLGNDPTNIFGTLASNGLIFLVNPSGILFAPGASVNVGGMVASTLSIKESDFLAEKYAFFRDGAPAPVVNQALLRGGFIALLAGSASNQGTIVTTRDSAVMAAGDCITLGFDPCGMVAIKVDKGAYNASIKNSGVIESENGTVVMSTSAADALLATVVNNSGKIRAGNMSEQSGNIVMESSTIINSGTLEAGKEISVTASGAMLNTGTLRAAEIQSSINNLLDAGKWNAGCSLNINASGNIEQTAASFMSADGDSGGTIRITAAKSLYLSGTLSANGTWGRGGNISITAPELYLCGSLIQANGMNGGGQIRIGGGWQGRQSDLANAATTMVSSSTSVNASALDSGNGGTVVLWSDKSTSFAGTIEAKGGANSGNGGKVEVSSHEILSFIGKVVTASPNGNNGSLLLDPRNITVDANASSQPLSLTPLSYANPSEGDQHGSGNIVELPNGNIIVASPLDDFVATDAGVVRLYKPDGTLLSMLTGSTANDQVGKQVKLLIGNNNAVTSTSNWSNDDFAGVGAVTWIDGTTGISGNVSAANSLVGSTANDGVGTSITALMNGNYVVSTGYWDKINPDRSVVTDVGAVTWGNGLGGTVGVVNYSNSLIGSSKNDYAGSDNVKSNNIIALTNGNYVVTTWGWDNGSAADAGAVTWGNGAGGTTGTINASNSLIGSTKNDYVGSDNLKANNVKALSNGNYVVSSGYWDRINADNSVITNAGAVTWGNGLGGTVGVVSASNSLVGSKKGNQIGNVTVLSNGNYVVSSPLWDNGSVANAGAVTWGDGLGGTFGTISSANSLVGSTANDNVGTKVTALTNGNYVVSSPHWNKGAGAVTWGDGTTGGKRLVGTLSASNSLTGTTATDGIGTTVTALTNGNYVVGSPQWNNGVGAATWGDGSTGGLRLIGKISSANSLVGSSTNDGVGAKVTALSNGNYVVSSEYWDKVNPDGSVVTDVGAVTWGNGVGGTVGEAGIDNSLIGSASNDNAGTIVTALAKGNYVVTSPFWDNGSATDAGAVTWGNGAGGTAGIISATNSLVGSTKNDYIGSDSQKSNKVTPLSNGNYVVSSEYWDKVNADNTISSNAGAVTWGNGQGGTVGVISSSNSLTGSKRGNQIGKVTALPNGNYVVSSPLWDNVSAFNAGAVTWGDGLSGTVGTVSTINSFVGSQTDDQIGSGGIIPLTVGTMQGSFIVSSFAWRNKTGRVDILSPTSLQQPYSFSPGMDNYFTPFQIASLLNAGNDVILKANNDIIINSAIVADNLFGNTGNLFLYAGRSILLNESITIDDSNLTLVANDTQANGVTDANRETGPALITMAPESSIDTGNGSVTIELSEGADKTFKESGDITLRNISAGTINVMNFGLTAGSGITLASGTLEASAASGNSIVLAGKEFRNNANALLSTTGTARWLIYSATPDATIKGGLASDFLHYNASYSSYGPLKVSESGKGFIYATPPANQTNSDSGSGNTAGNNSGSGSGNTAGNDSGNSSSSDTASNSGSGSGNTASSSGANKAVTSGNEHYYASELDNREALTLKLQLSQAIFNDLNPLQPPDLLSISHTGKSLTNSSLSWLTAERNLPVIAGKVAVPIVVRKAIDEFFIWPIPQSIFRISNPEEIVALELRSLNSALIPNWITFDPERKVISGIPPQEAKGEYQVELIAKDRSGEEARTILLVEVE